MKKALSMILALAMVFALCACSSQQPASTTAAATTAAPKADDTQTEAPAEESSEGKVFNIYAWNEEFKGFFEKYYTVPEGVTVNWIITPSDNGAYQEKLDQALLNQENAAADDKVDLFLAEADYIQKYTGSDFTQDVTKLGVTDFSNTYAYTVQCASDANGVVKGVSFQCCPAALIYRRSIAQDVLGTDDPAEVQKALSDWDKFNDVAAQAKAKGYMMTASESATYRVFSNNVDEPWVDADNNLQIPEAMKTWMQQAKDFTDNGYTQTCDIWSDGQPLIREVCLSVQRGRIVTLIGPNGSGKSTILKTVVGQLSKVSGTVLLEGSPMEQLRQNEIAKKMAILMTQRVHPELMTCFDVVSTGRYPYTGALGLLSKEDKRIVMDAMALVHSADLADRPFEAISDGQRQRILLARALCQQPEIIVLDEPTSYLDIRYKLELLTILKTMVREKNLAVLMSLHELDLADRVSDTVVCVSGDRIDRIGTPKEIFTSDYIARLYHMEPGRYDPCFDTLDYVPKA